MKQINNIKIVHQYDADTDLSYLQQEYKDCSQEDNEKYQAQDKARLERYNTGEIYDIGIYAIAEIRINETLQNIRSGGLWGVNSDSEEDYIKEVESDELDNLRIQLKEIGFKTRYINEAIKYAEHKDNTN